MYSYITGGTVFGIEGHLIRVETDVSDGLPGYHMVGCLSEAVREAGERIRTALRNSGYSIPPQKIIINLSPADLPKSGTGFDLPIALSILISLNILRQEDFEQTIVLGELGLNGSILPVHGVLPIVDTASKEHFVKALVPKDNVAEASLMKGIRVFGFSNLREVVEFLRNRDAKDCVERKEQPEDAEQKPIVDFSELRGQPIIRRGMEIAASGMHNLLMTGPPGAGKTMAAKCLPGILPDLSYEEQMVLTKIYSVKGLLNQSEGLMRTRPFRAPHHTISTAALLGGGSFPKPGEISLAHNGVLFLDELPEFQRSVIEALRQPLEEGKVTVNRTKMTYSFPADFMLIAAMNPCPCGCYPDRNKCNCSEHQILAYRGKISRAILDRIDLHLSIRPVSFAQIQSDEKEESSKTIRLRVSKVHEIQRKRFSGLNIHYNSQMSNREIRKFCALDAEGKKIMERAFRDYEMSARAYHRTLRLARTIADMDDSPDIYAKHLLEAVAYRSTAKED